MALTIVGRTRQCVDQAADVLQVAPREMNPGLCHTPFTEIDRDQVSIVALGPTPGHQVLKARIVWPAGALAEAPSTLHVLISPGYPNESAVISKCARFAGREEVILV